MHPLILALHLFTAAPYSATVTTTAPTHYISNVGFVDLTQATLPDATFNWPTMATKLTRGYSAGHSGMDIDARTNDAVEAAFSGVVTTVSHTGPYGNKIIISHPSHPEKISTMYAHLTDVYVTPGETITAGQLIGTVGTTGNADGDHLHLEVLENGVAVDPLPYF